jgi:hypothetical protein
MMKGRLYIPPKKNDQNEIARKNELIRKLAIAVAFIGVFLFFFKIIFF